MTKKAGLTPSARASAARRTRPVGICSARPAAASGSATRPIVAASPRRRSDQRDVEGRDGADKERRAEHVREVCERVEERRMARRVAQSGLLQGREPVEIGRHRQRSSKVLPSTRMRSARISRGTFVEG